MAMFAVSHDRPTFNIMLSGVLVVTAIFWSLAFALASAFSIAAMGKREFIGANLYSYSGIQSVLFSWQFVMALTLAVLARVSFIMANNAFMTVPRLSESATTITALVGSALGTIAIVAVNYFLLGERLNLQQVIGACLVILGSFLVSK